MLQVVRKTGGRLRFHVAVAGELAQESDQFEREERRGQPPGVESGGGLQGVDGDRIGRPEKSQQGGFVGREVGRFAVGPPCCGFGFEVPAHLCDDVFGREDELRLAVADQMIGAGSRAVGGAAGQRHDRAVVFVGEAGREQRTAVVGRFDDQAPGAQCSDDAVAGGVGGAVLAGLAVHFRHEGSSVVEDVAGKGRMLGGKDAGKRAGQNRSGGDLAVQCGAVGGRIDAESQAADYDQTGHAFGQTFDELVTYALSVGRHFARADDRQGACCEGLRIAFYIDDVGIVRDFAQQGRVVGIGRGDGFDVVFAAVFRFFFRRGEPRAADDLPGRFGAQFRAADQFRLRGFENPFCRSEALQQMHGSLDADARGHLQGDVFDGHDGVFVMDCCWDNVFRLKLRARPCAEFSF